MDRNGVGGRLKLYRQLRNLTQESLSEVIGVTKQHLGQIERGQCNPSLDFLSKAATALDTHIASFFLGNGNDPVMVNAHSFPEGDGGVRPFSTCGTWMLSGPGGKNIWSKSLCRMLGHASVRVPSLTQFCKHLTADAAGAFRAFFAQVLEGEIPDSAIFALTRKDGVQRRVQAVAEILNGGDGLAETACIIFWDMTDWLETRRIFHYTQQELNDTIRDRTAALTSAVSNAKRELELRQDAERAAQQAHSNLKKAAEEQRLLLENIQTQVWYLTDEQTYGAVNGAHAAFGGFTVKDMAYRDLYEIYPTDVADICRQGNERVFFSGRPVRTEEWLPHFSGDPKLVSILKSPKLRSDGTVEYVVCSAEDITDRWRSEEALKKAKELAEEASRLKSGFLASMSHEIRTPINGILGMLQLLQTTELSADQDAFVDMAVRSCDRLIRLLSDIMDFSRIEAGKLIIQAAPMSLESVFGQVRELFTPFLQDTKVTLDFTLDPALPCRILGDAFRLQQILNNLVDNACKFTSSGSVAVKASRLPSAVPGTVRIFFEVSDTGIGIPDDELKSLFDPFIQINDGYVRSRKGVGLGLSICKRLVELMGGSMSVISEAGKGTAFVFSLSFAMDSTLDHPGGADDRQATNLSGRRILLVEDDQVSAMAQQALLARHGGEVVHVRSGQEALDTLRRHPFDLVVMDVQMQDMDGIEATLRIRRGEAGETVRNIPVIALTACAMVGDREHFLAAGMNAYVAKPMDIREMLRVAGRILQG